MENSTLMYSRDWKTELWEALAFRGFSTLQLGDTIQEKLWSKNEEEKGKEERAKNGVWGLLQCGQGEETPTKKIHRK